MSNVTQAPTSVHGSLNNNVSGQLTPQSPIVMPTVGDIIVDYVGNEFLVQNYDPIARIYIVIGLKDIIQYNIDYSVLYNALTRKTATIKHMGHIRVDPSYVSPPKATECECGKDKHNFFAHSHWCPKYDKT